jgi:3-oxoacyl-[acyl-carrier-protein] synthase-3
MDSSKIQVGVLGMACALPLPRKSSRDLGRTELIADDEVHALGIEQVAVREAETASSLALAAARDALQRAGIDPAQVDVIVDYSILPQEYLVPAWNMSNKLQHELGATKAFTVGFSGGASANVLMALSSATAMLQSDTKLKTALLVAGDVAIAGNRILQGSGPVTILGDSGGAVVLRRDAERAIVVDVEIETRGENHDVCYIPGGALASHDPEKYRVTIDSERYQQALASDHLKTTVRRLLERNGMTIGDIACAILPNLSRAHQSRLEEMLGLDPRQVCGCKLPDHGHLQGTDLVVNYLALMERSAINPGDHVLLVSDGMGFMSGAVLLRY